MRHYLCDAPGRVGDAIQRVRQDTTPVLPLPHLQGGEQWWPLSNVWLGVSVEDQQRADERIPLLLDTPAAVRFVSAEPLLAAIDLTDITKRGMRRDDGNATTSNSLKSPILPGSLERRGGRLYNEIDWVIAGGESGPGARLCRIEWVRTLRDQCQAAAVPFFFKQWGRWVHESQMSEDAWVWMNGLTTGADRSDGYWPLGKKRAGHLLEAPDASACPRRLKVENLTQPHEAKRPPIFV